MLREESAEPNKEFSGGGAVGLTQHGKDCFAYVNDESLIGGGLVNITGSPDCPGALPVAGRHRAGQDATSATVALPYPIDAAQVLAR